MKKPGVIFGCGVLLVVANVALARPPTTGNNTPSTPTVSCAYDNEQAVQNIQTHLAKLVVLQLRTVALAKSGMAEPFAYHAILPLGRTSPPILKAEVEIKSEENSLIDYDTSVDTLMKPDGLIEQFASTAMIVTQNAPEVVDLGRQR
jgi:hypothetical protein